MCGIAGIAGYASLPVALKTAIGFGRSLLRRGPDGEGGWQDDRVILTHRRLAVIDCAHSVQPMTNEDGSLVLAVNGEIYNFRALRAELEAQGHRFATAGDSEVILHGYEAYGAAIFARLDGMFALALYDVKRQLVWLARDLFGKKPLFYWQNGPELVFGSTLNALKCHPEFPRRAYRAQAIREFLSYWYVPGPETVYAGVFQAPPGHWLCYDLAERRLSAERYAALDYRVKSELPLPELVRGTRERLVQAVAKRLVADVPLGAFLSGGLDSLLVTGLMLQAGRRDLPLFTIGFDEAAYDERAEAKQSCAQLRRLGLNAFVAQELVVKADDLAFLRLMLREAGQPYGDASILPTGLLCRFARQGVTVALSGDGADELFGGYERYRAMRFFAAFDRWPAAMRAKAFAAAAALIPAGGERTRQGKYKRLFELGRHPAAERYYHLMTKAEETAMLPLLGGRLRDGWAADESRRYLLACLAAARTPEAAERFAEADIDSYLANDILPKMDTASMSCGLEVRSPFLDRDLAQWAAGLPFGRKLDGSSRKDILKRACQDLIPPELGRRPKRGFGVPVAAFLAGPWRGELERALTRGHIVRDGWIDRDGAQALLRRSDQAAVNLQWGLFCLEIFFENEFV